jgi:hypothetical protein
MLDHGNPITMMVWSQRCPGKEGSDLARWVPVVMGSMIAAWSTRTLRTPQPPALSLNQTLQQFRRIHQSYLHYDLWNYFGQTHCTASLLGHIDDEDNRSPSGRWACLHRSCRRSYVEAKQSSAGATAREQLTALVVSHVGRLLFYRQRQTLATMLALCVRSTRRSSWVQARTSSDTLPSMRIRVLTTCRSRTF